MEERIIFFVLVLLWAGICFVCEGMFYLLFNLLSEDCASNFKSINIILVPSVHSVSFFCNLKAISLAVFGSGTFLSSNLEVALCKRL